MCVKGLPSCLSVVQRSPASFVQDMAFDYGLSLRTLLLTSAQDDFIGTLAVWQCLGWVRETRAGISSVDQPVWGHNAAVLAWYSEPDLAVDVLANQSGSIWFPLPHDVAAQYPALSSSFLDVLTSCAF